MNNHKTATEVADIDEAKCVDNYRLPLAPKYHYLETRGLRSLGTWENPLFVGKDVCDMLGITAYRDALARLDEWDKGCRVRLDTLGGPQEFATVTESGLYNLIFRSDKPEAKAFRKWITTEVLPSIRKTGRYALSTFVDGDGGSRLIAAAEPRRKNRGTFPELQESVESLMRAMWGRQMQAVHLKAILELVDELELMPLLQPGTVQARGAALGKRLVAYDRHQCAHASGPLVLLGYGRGQRRYTVISATPRLG